MTKRKAPPKTASMKKVKDEFLRRDRAMGAASQLEIMFAEGSDDFPPVVETLWRMFNDDSVEVSERFNKDGDVISRSEKPRVTTKEKIAIAQSMAHFIGLKEQALAEVGLGKSGPKKVENHTHATQINLTVEEVDQLPDALRAKLTAHMLDDASKGSA